MKKYYYIFAFSLISSGWLAADPTICFFFKPMPDVDYFNRKLKQPGKIAQHKIHSILEHQLIAGIYSVYAGYITVSDYTGEVQFPRKHRENAVTILVTPDLEPISLFENTIDHWVLVPHQPAEMYSLQEIYNPKTKEYSWQSRKMDLPLDSKIPTTAIVIIANPKHITIPSEITKTTKSANLVLPNIYVKKGIDIMYQGIETLNIRLLFRPVQQKIQQSPLRFTTHLLN